MRLGWWTIAPVVVVMVGLVAVVVLGAAVDNKQGTSCGAVDFDVRSAGGLGADQLLVAKQAVAAVRAYPPTAQKPHAAVIVLATGFQESRLRDLAYGDRDSLGFLQQRPSQGWGTPAQVRDVAYATRSFLDRLVQVPGWEARQVTDVASDVQRPAGEYRGLYQRWVPMATTLVERLWATSSAPSPARPVASTTVHGVTCGELELAAGSGASSVTYPVPAALAGSDQHNWGGRGERWSSWHTGTDFAVPCGTPVLAATAGTIQIDTAQSWAGTWLVKVSTGPGRLTTWYAHMQRVLVSAGQQVKEGQAIGETGARGNATGCHLHFEVHLTGGSIYGPDNTDPSAWLAPATHGRE